MLVWGWILQYSTFYGEDPSSLIYTGYNRLIFLIYFFLKNLKCFIFLKKQLLFNY